MKRYIACIAALAVLTAFSGCGKDKSSNSESLKGADFQTEVGTLQPDPLAPASTEAADDESGTGSAETTTSTEVEDGENGHNGGKSGNDDNNVPNEPDPLGGGAFTCDENGAVVFEKYEDADDRTLMAAAERLFESACETQWKFMFDMPFNTDSNTYIENEFGWRYYLVTDPDVNSLADVENEYHKVFSDKYPNDLKDNFVEKEGRVYGFSGGRGSNIFYSASKVTAVKSVTDDEIFFTVTNYYSGTDIDGSAPYEQEDEFSVVISDNTWRVGKFTLPY